MNTIHSQPVKLNEKEIEKLIATYKKAYKQVVNEIVTIKDFKIRTRRQTLANIREILIDLKVDVDKWVETEIEKQYTGGALDAIRELRSQGADVEKMSSFNRIHREAINGLVTETQDDFAVSMSGINHQAKILLGKATREQITARLLEGQITGKTLNQIKKNIIGDLKEQGLAALVDKGGRKWSLDRYSQMIIRTKMVEARNRGLSNRLAELGYDLVLVSAHGSKHYECAVWEGRVLSMTGATPGYPTLDEAQSAGLFHPNCLHAINTFVSKLNPDYEEPTPPPRVTIENLDD
jgi:hypothetical protein